MKVKAYVLDKATNTYLQGQGGQLLKVHVETAAAFKNEYPHAHKQREYRSIRLNPDIRQKLKIIKKGDTYYYSYYDDNINHIGEIYDESESHKAVIIALSRLKTMRFHAKNSNLPLDVFNFKEVLIEHKVELPNGRVYCPDLLCRFDESHPLYDRWGGKLAIEVTYSHPCDETKIHDFEFNNIPIIEVVINKGSPREYPGERHKWRDYSLSSIEKHTNDLENWFREFISVNILVDPVSTRVHNTIIKEKNAENKTLHKNIWNFLKTSHQLRKKINISIRKWFLLI